MDKQSLRSKHRKRRQALVSEEILEKSKSICGRIKREGFLSSCSAVLFYYPAPNSGEVDLRPLLQLAFHQLSSVTCSLPRVDVEEKKIIPYRVPVDGINSGDELRELYSLEHPDSPLEEGPFKIPQPRPKQCAPLDIVELDLVFVPGLVFDGDGYRIGFGGGYYDRLLTQLPSSTDTIGIGYDWQVIDRCPREGHDRPVSRIVTEKRTISI